MTKTENYKKETLLERDGITVDVDTEGSVEIKKGGAEVVKLTKQELEFISKVTKD